MFCCAARGRGEGLVQGALLVALGAWLRASGVACLLRRSLQFARRKR